MELPLCEAPQKVIACKGPMMPANVNFKDGYTI